MFWLRSSIKVNVVVNTEFFRREQNWEWVLIQWKNYGVKWILVWVWRGNCMKRCWYQGVWSWSKRIRKVRICSLTNWKIKDEKDEAMSCCERKIERKSLSNGVALLGMNGWKNKYTSRICSIEEIGADLGSYYLYDSKSVQSEVTGRKKNKKKNSGGCC